MKALKKSYRKINKHLPFDTKDETVLKECPCGAILNEPEIEEHAIQCEEWQKSHKEEPDL